LTSVAFTSFGDYDQCLDIESPAIDENGSVIAGKFCMIELAIPINYLKKKDKIFMRYENFINSHGLGDLFTPSYFYESIKAINGTLLRCAICVPSECGRIEIQNALNKGMV
jgi:hypothetical protein